MGLSVSVLTHRFLFFDTSVCVRIQSNQTIRTNAIDAAIIQAMRAKLGFLRPNPKSSFLTLRLFRVVRNSIHILMRLNFIYECIYHKFELKFIYTDLQVADVLTKLLPLSAHE
jgi:hypothetical protein